MLNRNRSNGFEPETWVLNWDGFRSLPKPRVFRWPFRLGETRLKWRALTPTNTDPADLEWSHCSEFLDLENTRRSPRLFTASNAEESFRASHNVSSRSGALSSDLESVEAGTA